MSIFSKWFGSKEKEEQREEIAEEKVSFKEDSQDKVLPDPKNLAEALRYIVEKWGVDYLQNRCLLNILNDFQVLKDMPAAKHIILNMQANGYIEKISNISNWGLESKSISANYSNEFGAKEDIVSYLVQCLGYGLKLHNNKSKFEEIVEKTQNQFTDPTTQPIKFSPQNNNPMPVKKNPSLSLQSPSKPQPIPQSPYDPKGDLEFYQYPTINLLDDISSNNIISIKSVLNSSDFQNSTMELPCAIGKKENGEILLLDLVEAPHLMVSGASGMGISVFFNTIIASLLFKKHPAELKFVMIDPKKIEFSLYNPLKYHFLAGLSDTDPVMTDMGRMSELVLSLYREMEKRLDLFKDAGVRSIKDYNRKFCERKLNPGKGHEYLPYLVVLIDEYDVISSYYGKVLESPLESISRTGRSVGMHLIISVQRPVGTVISAGIKANIVSRISFRVTSINESRNILSRGGAEKLQSPGDMIYTNGIDLFKSKCALIDLAEIGRINQFISSQQGFLTPYELANPDAGDSSDSYLSDVDMAHLDPLFEDAARLVVINQSGSPSLIQRKFAIGFNRAGRLMDQLEKAGIVGAAMGSKPREVMIQDENSLKNLIASLK